MSTVLEHPSTADQAADFKFPPELETNAEQREAPIERLDHKVRAVMNMASTIESLKNEHAIDRSKIQNTLNGLWTETIALFPPDTIKRYQRQQEVERDINNAHRRLDLFMTDAGMSVEDIKQERALIKQLRRESTQLLADEDVNFLQNVDSAIHSLRHKNDQVLKIRDDQTEIIKQYNHYLGRHDIHPADILKTEVAPFEISLIISDRAYRHVYGHDSYGTHFSHSPFSLIREQPDTALTEQHEGVHNLLDQVGGVGQYSNRFEKIVEAYENNKKSVDRQAIEQELLDYQPADLIDQMHDEFAANFTEWEKVDITNNRSPVKGQPVYLDPFLYKVTGYTTPGENAMNTIKSYDLAIKGCADRTIKKALQERRVTFTKLFAQNIKCLELAVIRARSMGGDAIERVKAAMFVLPPSRYRHLDRYLDYVDKQKNQLD